MSPIAHESHCTGFPLHRFLCEGGGPVDYEPIRMLYAAGFTDFGGGNELSPSVPTPANVDPSHAARLRLDYVLLSPACLALGGSNSSTLGALGARTWPHSISTICTADTDKISDHYPVILDLSREPVSASTLVHQLSAARAILAFY